MALGVVNVSGVMQSDIEEVKQDIQYVSNLRNRKYRRYCDRRYSYGKTECTT